MNKSISILFACVNYNTNDKLNDLLDSINKAYLKTNKNLNIDILIGDNSKKFQLIPEILEKNIKITHVENRANLGYIGGVVNSLNESKTNISNYDYFIISNVDLKLDDNFFNELIELEQDSSVGWYAPSIISEKEGRDRNPKILYRPSLKKMKLTILMYKFPIFYYLYLKFIYVLRSKKIQSNNLNNEIYAGHGSFMIFTKNFNDKNEDFSFPSFLFGEEIYFAEQVKNSKLKTVYIPKLRIYDFDHASTSKIKKRKYFKLNYQSMKIITQKYFTNE
ncbi:MAG: glycosyltransferase [Bacteroidales bacterium]|nr:glycosyltransferase [Bacteroidales bacterium]